MSNSVRGFFGFIFVTALLVAPCNVSAARSGDCDNDGTVSITEIQSAINMFLGLKTPMSCVDTNGDITVSIAEVK